jgi:rhodanese-related sulfurtransferase
MVRLPLCALALALAACSTSSPGTTDAGPADAAPVDARAADTAATADAPAPDAAADDAAPPAGDAGCDGWTTLVRLTPRELHDLLATSDPILINVHIPLAGDIPGTDAEIAYTDVAAIEAFIGPDRCADVVLYCLTGPMSVSAGNALIADGYRRVRDLAGGLNAWEAAGYPVE